MKYKILTLALLVTACGSEPSYDLLREQSVEDITVVDSLEEMMAFIQFVDSAGIVEQVSSDFVELKETNEQLETTLEETKQELATTKEELTETKTTLQKAEQIVKAITGDSSTNATGFELLPIKK